MVVPVIRLDLRSKQSIAVPAERDDRIGQVAAKQKHMRPWVSGSAGLFGAKPETQNEKISTR
ncbi:hypothetical protein SPHINGOR109_50710 [Sphingorhabdus sp. 109]|nr:hypothetical protein SPHINGOR109_50710 [Sphingorhabdus sp. 109]